MAAKCYAQLRARNGQTFPVRVETTHDEIEKEMAVKLHRSRSYLIANDDMFGTHVLVIARATVTCSGCARDIEYSPGPGIGCEECGYTGKRVWSQWVPAREADEFHKGDFAHCATKEAEQEQDANRQ